MEELSRVFGDDFVILPDKLSDSDDIENQFKKMLGSPEAGNERGVVYFFFSNSPVPTKLNESRIIYIGKTKGSIKTRYLPLAKKLASGKNGEFYKGLIVSNGGVKMGYIKSDHPREDEKAIFRKYRDIHGQNPTKSIRG